MPIYAPTAAPTTAERIRSACARGRGAMLAVGGLEPALTRVHHLLQDGSFAVTLPAEGAAVAMVNAHGNTGVQALLEMTDFAPLPLRKPVRSLVWIRGRLRGVASDQLTELLDLIAAADPNPALLQVTTSESCERQALLRLEIESAVIADSTGAESVAPEVLLGASPDPFCDMESCWLQHMESAHADIVDRLAGRLPAALRHGRAWPLGLDRYGLQLRIEGALPGGGDHDVRFPFARPVDDVAELNRAVRLLLGCPFANGLRARDA